MDNASVRPVADPGGREQRFRLPGFELWKESVQPRTESTQRERAAHALRFTERRREKILATRLPGLAIRILREPAPRGTADQRRKRTIADRLRTFHRERERESAIAVGAGTVRVGRLGQVSSKPRDKHQAQGTQRLCPCAPLRVCVTAEF